MLKNWVVANEQDCVELMHSVKHTLTVDGDGSALHGELLKQMIVVLRELSCDA